MTPPRSKTPVPALVDPDAITQPIMERILSIALDIQSRITAVERHQDEHDRRFADQNGAINLVGNIATRALEVSEAGEERWKRIEQTLDGVNELARSTFDIVTGNRVSIAVSD